MIVKDQRPHKSSQSDSNSTQEGNYDPPSNFSSGPAMSVKSPQSGTSPTKRVNLTGRSFMNALHSATSRNPRNTRNSDTLARQQQAQFNEKDSTSTADNQRRKQRREKHDFDDDRRSQRSRRSSDSRSSPIPEDIFGKDFFIKFFDKKKRI